MNVFCFVLSAFVILGFFIALLKPNTKTGDIAVAVFIVGALALAAAAFSYGIGVIFGGL